jgi:hypothetical protein
MKIPARDPRRCLRAQLGGPRPAATRSSPKSVGPIISPRQPTTGRRRREPGSGFDHAEPALSRFLLVSTWLEVIVPVLKNSENIATAFGPLVIAGASIADFGAIVLLSLFFSGKSSTTSA